MRQRSLYLFAAVAISATASVMAQSTTDEIAKYRQLLADGNPAELWEMRGEELWRTKAGPKNVSLEQCDLGKGCLLYTSPSPRDVEESRMPSSA